MVLVGAEGVVESGGIINKLGTHHIAIAAKAQGIPFYVAAESYKVGLHSPYVVQKHSNLLCCLVQGRSFLLTDCMSMTVWLHYNSIAQSHMAVNVHQDLVPLRSDQQQCSLLPPCFALLARCQPGLTAPSLLQFARLYPLNQSDLPVERKACDFGPLLPKSCSVVNPSRDYTPPKHITLLFTDLGVLTPAAVSDELILLYA